MIRRMRQIRVMRRSRSSDAILYDPFDGAGAPGSAPTGQAWTQRAGSTWSKAGGLIRLETGGAPTRYFLTADTLVSSIEIEAAISNFGDVANDAFGLTFNYVDDTNYCCMIHFGGAIYVQKIVASVQTTLITGAYTANNGDRFKIRRIGSLWTAYVNDSQFGAPASDAAHASATHHGLFGYQPVAGNGPGRIADVTIRRAA